MATGSRGTAADDRQPLAFFPDGHALITAGNAVVVWPVPAVNRADRADRIARIPSLVGLRYDEQGELQRLSPGEWARAIGDRLAGAAVPPDALDWHDRTAAHCENFGPAWAALWHLDRLIAARSNQWSLFARRARIYRQLGDPAHAEADEARAARWDRRTRFAPGRLTRPTTSPPRPSPHIDGPRPARGSTA